MAPHIISAKRERGTGDVESPRVPRPSLTLRAYDDTRHDNKQASDVADTLLVAACSVTLHMLDAAAAFTPDKKKLTVAIVNPTNKSLDLPLTLQGVSLSGSGMRYEIAGDDPMAYNAPGQPPGVSIEEAAVADVGETLTVAACSVTLYVLDVE